MCARVQRFLLLLLPGAAWAALQVSVPSSPLRFPPGSDARLPCNIVVSSGSINMSRLALMWKNHNKMSMVTYSDMKLVNNPRAELSVEQLKRGDATLVLRGVMDADAGIYTCYVIYQPDAEERQLELRVEAPPQLSLDPTPLRLGQKGTVGCSISGFYPGSVSAEWLRNGVPVGASESLTARPGPNGLFSAQAALLLTPQIADAQANYSCRVRHQALDAPLERSIQLRIQALPQLSVQVLVTEESVLRAARCLVSGFYPAEIRVQWLRSGMKQTVIQSQPESSPQRTFSIESVVFPEEKDPQVVYTCRVEHDSLLAPLEQNLTWEPRAKECVPKYVSVILGFLIALVLIIAVVLLVCMCRWRGKIMMLSQSRPTENTLL